MSKKLFKISAITSVILVLGACGSNGATTDTTPSTSVKPSIPTTPTPIEPTEDGTFKPTIIDGNASDWEFIEERSDEFNDGTIDTNKWENDPNDFGPWSWRPENVSLTEDGKLRLTMDYEEHTGKRPPEYVDHTMYYTSGMIRAKTIQTYGYYEAKIRGSHTFPGSSPAFWIYSNAVDRDAAGMKPTEKDQPFYSEVDFIELQQAEWSDITGVYKQDDERVLDMNLHAVISDEHGGQVQVRPHNNYAWLAQNKMRADFDPRADFHIYGAEVSEEEVIWYLDGKEVFRKPNNFWHLPMRVTLSLGLRAPQVTYKDCPHKLARCSVPSEATADGYPTHMDVDWVRVYKRVE